MSDDTSARIYRSRPADEADPITDDDIARMAELQWPFGRWWERDAFLAYRRGHFLIIRGRKDTNVYLVRFWLTEPKRREGGELDSSDSVLLHFFARGDDDESLHDHPWSFSTRILCGSYVENLPPNDWAMDLGGPAWDQLTCRRATGYRGHHQATDLHCVSWVEPGTWTLVTTGPFQRKWGFHPPGKPWVYYRDYLGLPPASAGEESH